MLKQLLAIILIGVFIINIAHAYLLDCNHSHTIKEYVQEFSAPIHHDDGCKMHFMYHQSFVLQKSGINIETLKLSQKIETSIEQIFSIFLKIPPKPPKSS